MAFLFLLLLVAWPVAELIVFINVAEAIGVLDAFLLLIAAVWVNPDARDADAVYANNRRATADALANGAAGRPSVADVLARRHEPVNPYFTPVTPEP